MSGIYYVVMAGFAVIGGLIAAVMVSIWLVLRARKHLPTATLGRTAFLFANALAPLLGLGWIIAAASIHVYISSHWAHQDCGFSGDPYVTLPNGYVLGSLNTYNGYIVAPGFQTQQPIMGPGYMRSLIDIELKGDQFVGTVHNFNTNKEWSFIFSTRDRSIQTADTGHAISFEETENRVHSDPNSYWKMYSRYRHRWPMVVFLDLLAFGEGGIIIVMRKFWELELRRAKLVAS